MNLYDKASLIITPNAYKASKIYAAKPTSGAGDPTVTRAGVKRVRNAAGNWVQIAANVPPLQYPVGAGCPAWLPETQLTYQNTRDSDLPNAAWTKVGCTIDADSEVFPFEVNADVIVEDATTLVHGVHRASRPGGLTIGQAYFVVFYAKRITRDWVYFSDFNGFQLPAVNVWFNLATGVVGTANGGVINPRMVHQGNGIYECSFHFVATGVSGASCDYRIAASTADNTLNYAGTLNQRAIAVMAAQWGLGRIIPTPIVNNTDSTVTRNADVISRTGISSLIGQTEGVIFVKARLQGQSFTDSVPRVILSISDSTINNRIEISRINNTINVLNVAGGVVQFNGSVFTITDFTGQFIDIALQYSLNNVKTYINQVLAHTDTTALIPACSQLNVGSISSGSFQWNGVIDVVYLYNTLLTDAEVIAINP